MAYNKHQRHHGRSKSASEELVSSAKDESLFHAKNGSKKGSQTAQHLLAQSKIETSPNSHATLKDDIKNLGFELHQEKSLHAELEMTTGGALTASSPRHVHFSAQIKELMDEIEMLEEEIASREKHVLSLYRSIFDQCNSTAPSSEQGSSMASPAHNMKKGPKKHPMVISSAFCTSKKSSFLPFHVWGASSKQKFIFKSEVRRKGSISTEPDSIHLRSKSSNESKEHYQGSYNVCTSLKEELNKCPNKISEEMVRYMATIYRLLHWTDLSEKTEKVCAPFLSRSSTIVLPRRSNGRKYHFSSEKIFEMSSVWSEKYQGSDASSAVTNYRLLVQRLERVNLDGIDQNAKRAFWLNIYNSLVMHAYLAYGAPSSLIRRMLLIHKAAYNIGGHIVTASYIEHYILRCHTLHTGRWIETIFITAKRKKSVEEKDSSKFCYALPECEPLVLFAMCTGSSSDPMLRVYTPKNLSDELKKARKEYLQANVVIKKSRRVLLPKVVERYAKEASLSYDGLLKLVCSSLDGKYPDFVQNCKDLTRKKASQIIEWLPHNARFHYVFAKDLTQKPSVR
ncbi:hypothetical protein LUZ62_035847 [Rhynchospora pubera]|uniref:DUF547 domain-containing protein n=1 Tax=Rhynchospora pubera TaxID=906938 RepID=A0AAV8F1X2_9POAL|nr:hypothetical protein LUZ62_035847 [Rhynchospora pubera]